MDVVEIRGDEKVDGEGGEKSRRRARDEDGDDDERGGKGRKGSPERVFAGGLPSLQVGR